jgi:hypothetical protein
MREADELIVRLKEILVKQDIAHRWRVDKPVLWLMEIKAEGSRGFDILIADDGDEWNIAFGSCHTHFLKQHGADEPFNLLMDGLFGYAYVVVQQRRLWMHSMIRSKTGSKWETSHRLCVLVPSFRAPRWLRAFRNMRQYG